MHISLSLYVPKVWEKDWHIGWFLVPETWLQEMCV